MAAPFEIPGECIASCSGGCGGGGIMCCFANCLTSCCGGGCGFCSECVGCATCNTELCSNCMTGDAFGLGCNPVCDAACNPGSGVAICDPSCMPTDLCGCGYNNCDPCSPGSCGTTDQPPSSGGGGRSAGAPLGGGSGGGSAKPAGGSSNPKCTQMAKLSQAMSKLGATMANLLSGGRRMAQRNVLPGQKVQANTLGMSPNTFLLVVLLVGGMLLFMAFGHKTVAD